MGAVVNMAKKSVARVRRLTGSIARPYMKRIERPFKNSKTFTEGTGAGSWFRTGKGSGVRNLVAKRIRAERAAGFIYRGRKDY